MSPEILRKHGWSLYFYSEEGSHSVHIHARKGDIRCKYYLDPDEVQLVVDYEYGASPAERRTIRKLIYENFDYIVSEYERFHKGEL